MSKDALGGWLFVVAVLGLGLLLGSIFASTAVQALGALLLLAGFSAYLGLMLGIHG